MISMNNEQIKTRKLELKKEIEQLSDKIGNPTAYTLADHQPYVNSPQLALDKEKLKQKVAEYNSLVESIVVAELKMDKVISFTDGVHTIKYVPKANRYDFYVGQEYQKGKVVLSEDGTTATVTVPTVNSGTHGETVNYVYKVKILEPKDQIVKKSKCEPRCSKIDEGMAMIFNPDEQMMRNSGFIKDPLYHVWRKQTPEEYQAKLIQEQKKKPKQPKKGNGKLSFGRFLKK